MKILFIACYAPFINNSAAIETLQYLNNLSGLPGNEVHLLTVNFPKDSIYYDNALAQMIDKRVKIHLVDGGKLFNKLVPRKIAANNIQVPIKKSNIKKMKLLRKVKNAIVIPDMYYSWARNAGKYGKDLMETEKFDVIFSMHEPPSSHLCAYYIKKEYKEVPWITYWSDPWLKDSTREKSFFLKQMIEAKMEKKVVALADKFIFVTEANRKDYIKTYNIPIDKSYIVTRGFDTNLYNRLYSEPVPKLIQKEKVNIVYAGEIFSKLRNIRPFIKALNLLKEENNDLYSKMNILFFGNIDDAEGKQQLEALDGVSVSGRIPFDDALKYMLNSEVLLLFGNKNSKQIPAKIYEYFGAKGKIFVIYGDEEDPIKKIVNSHKRCTTTLNNHIEIKEKLVELIEAGLEDGFMGEVDNNYEWHTIVERLNNILEG